MYYDLGLTASAENKDAVLKCLDFASELLYTGVAFNCVASKASDIDMTKPLALQSLYSAWSSKAPERSWPSHVHPRMRRKALPAKLSQFSRLSLVTGDPSKALTVMQNSRNHHAFDILAVQPTSAVVLDMACKRLDVDIITIDTTTAASSLQLPAALLEEATKRGIHFELCLAPILNCTSSGRAAVLATAAELCRVLRRKNLILSSGATGSHQLRSPKAMLAFGQMLGLGPESAKAAISSSCQAVLDHAKQRKLTSSTPSEREGLHGHVTATPSIQSAADLDKEILSQEAGGNLQPVGEGAASSSRSPVAQDVAVSAQRVGHGQIYGVQPSIQASGQRRKKKRKR